MRIARGDKSWQADSSIFRHFISKMGFQQTSGAASPKPFPKTVIIIGAGVFGLSTALAIAKKHPSTEVTLIDRLTPPVLDGTSVDTTRCIRADYADPVYAKFARESQLKLRNDPDLSRFMFTQGMTFACDGEPSRYTNLWKGQREGLTKDFKPEDIVDMPTRESVFQRIHGPGAKPQPQSALVNNKSRWNVAYCNLEDAFIDAEACVKICYERCLAQPSITTRCGTPVKRITVENGVAKGVILEDGTNLQAELVIVAAGAWSNKLVYLNERVAPTCHEVAWIKVTPEEEKQWKNMAITTNMSTGLNLFPPYNGEMKILRRSPGYKNTIKIPHPEDSSKTIEISYPRTKVSNPTDNIPLEAEIALRNDLREIIPPIADRPFDRTKLCWLSITPTSDFIICPHPRIAGVHMAAGGSAHGWKFLPIIGDQVVSSIEGVLPPELVKKWAYDRPSQGLDGNSPIMEGKKKEINDYVRSHL